jgi:hypothetical protein
MKESREKIDAHNAKRQNFCDSRYPFWAFCDDFRNKQVPLGNLRDTRCVRKSAFVGVSKKRPPKKDEPRKAGRASKSPSIGWKDNIK